MKTILIVLVTALATTAVVARLPKADLKGFNHWTAKELKGYERSLAAKVAGEARIAGQPLADYGVSNVAITRREAKGQAELHDLTDDYFIVEGGEATLVIGGEISDAKTTAPNETRGSLIAGGERRKLLTGDVVHIPAKMAHQLIIEPGKQFTYFVIKVKVG